MTAVAFLPFEREMDQYSSISQRFARNFECSKGIFIILL